MGVRVRTKIAKWDGIRSQAGVTMRCQIYLDGLFPHLEDDAVRHPDMAGKEDQQQVYRRDNDRLGDYDGDTDVDWLRTSDGFIPNHNRYGYESKRARYNQSGFK